MCVTMMVFKFFSEWHCAASIC